MKEIKGFKELPMFACVKCKFNYSISDNNVLYGLWYEGRLLRCGKCHSNAKHQFWLERAIEEDGL